MPSGINRVPDIALNDGHTIPQLGFGAWQVDQLERISALKRDSRTGGNPDQLG